MASQVTIRGDECARPTIGTKVVSLGRDGVAASSRWYALLVAHQHEKKVASTLRAKGLEVFLPLCRAERQWSDRSKQLELPLFPSYVFCRFQFGTHRAVVTTRGVRSIVGIAGKPIPIPDEEIAALQTIIASGLPVEPWDYLPEGEVVQIEQGPLRGLRGVLVRREDSWRLVSSVQLLVRSAAVAISRNMLSPVRAATAVA